MVTRTSLHFAWFALVMVLTGCGLTASRSGGSAIQVNAQTLAGVKVTGTTSTQAILSYTAPDSNACQLQVSENPNLSPPVHDVDAQLFPGSNSDGGGATQREWVIGKRTVARGSDGGNYSRALQANTTHYYQLTCGRQMASGSFDTMNIPLGKTFAEPKVYDGNNYVFPSVPNVRGYTLIDPRTGALLRRVTLKGDGTRATVSWFSGTFHVCSDVLSNGGYHCAILTQGATGVLYWINPSDGSSRLLGNLFFPPGADYQNGVGSATMGGMFDASNPNIYYATTKSLSSLGTPRVVVLRGTYTGNDQAVRQGSVAPVSWVNLTPAANNRTLPDQISAFDPSYNSSLFPNCNIRNVQSHYLILQCLRWEQDSAGWNVVADISNGFRIAAAQKMYANPQSRWCSIHNQEYAGNITTMNVVTQSMHGHGSSGPYVVTLTSAIGTGDTSFSVSGEPLSTAPPPDGISFLQNDAVGDVFQFMDGTGEQVQITSKASSTSLGMVRGYGNTPIAAHAAGAAMYPTCGTPVGTNSTMPIGSVFWDFVDDPHGTDSTGTYYYPDNALEYNGHRVFRQPQGSSTGWDVMEGWLVRTRYTMPRLFKQPPSFYVTATPSFAGFVAGNNSNAYMEHPSYDQVLAPPAEQLWFLDETPFLGLHYPDSASLISGSLYQFNFAASHAFTPNLPYFAMSNAHQLQDASGPASLLTGGVADNYKFCVAKKAGECQPGSMAGSVYFNVPGLAQTNCAGSDGAAPNVNDICINNLAPWGEAVVQMGMASDQTGTNPRDHIPVYGGKGAKSRVLVSGTSLGKYRLLSTYANAHSLPDGSWALFPSNLTNLNNNNPVGAADIFLVKIPPTPAEDGIDRSNYEPIAVATNAVAGAVTASVAYGYEENGPRSSFYCTQRPEPCTVTTAPGSSVSLPGVPQRILFYQVSYLDGSGNVVSSDDMQAVAVP